LHAAKWPNGLHQATFIKADVSSEDDVEQMMQQVSTT
jgi:hypothetical protein